MEFSGKYSEESDILVRSKKESKVIKDENAHTFKIELKINPPESSEISKEYFDLVSVKEDERESVEVTLEIVWQ